MKKLFVAAFAAVAFTISAFAQKAVEKSEVIDPNDPAMIAQQYGRRIVVSRFPDNWEISARIGTQGYMGEYCLDIFDLRDWWVFPGVDLGITKWATNTIGVNVGFTYSPFKSLYQDIYPGQQEKKYAAFGKDGDERYYRNNGYCVARGHMGNVYIDAILNLNNLFGGKKKSYFYTAVAYIGGGIMFPISEAKYNDICASFNAGIINKFRLTSHLSLDLAIRGTLHDDMFNGVSYYNSDDHKNLSVDATIGATVGLSYRFNWVSSKKRDAKGRLVNDEGWKTVEDVAPYTESYRAIQKQLADAMEKLNAAPAPVIIKEKADTQFVAVKDTFSYRQFVNFVIDRWELSNREKVSILLASEVIKEHPDTKFVIAGYADMQTATPPHNKMLSINRANAVYDCLVNMFHVNPDQLKKTWFGGVDYMFFNDKQCSRCVIIATEDAFEKTKNKTYNKK